MYEGRVPVSSATVIAGWPDELQRRIVDELRRKRQLYTRQIDEIKQEYERLHPPPPKPSRVAPMPHAPEPPPFDDWYEDEPVAYSGPSSGATTPSVPQAVSPPPDSQSPPGEMGDDTASDEPPNDPREFVRRLDEALLALARETRGSNLSRAAWIDRCMRAWDLSEPE
jgi:hypothetical protein